MRTAAFSRVGYVPATCLDAGIAVVLQRHRAPPIYSCGHRKAPWLPFRSLRTGSCTCWRYEVSQGQGCEGSLCPRRGWSERTSCGAAGNLQSHTGALSTCSSVRFLMIKPIEGVTYEASPDGRGRVRIVLESRYRLLGCFGHGKRLTVTGVLAGKIHDCSHFAPRLYYVRELHRFGQAGSTRGARRAWGAARACR